jgi:4-oxalocrotonate tautomerase family enzyme
MPYIQVEMQQGLPPEEKKAMVSEIVTLVNKTIGSSRAHINVALIELPPENIGEAGEPNRRLLNR